MPFRYNVVDLCPEAYNLLSNPEALYEALGYDEELFYETFEMTPDDIAAFQQKLRRWGDLIPSSWSGADVYVVPDEILEWNENGLLLDLNEMVCDGETGGFHVLTLSTEEWGFL